MKHFNLIRIFVMIIAVFITSVSLQVLAANVLTGTCPGYCNPDDGGNSSLTDHDAFYLLINTEANGNITFEILGKPGNTETVFRNDGWADGVVLGITVDGDPNTGNKYFTRTINAEKTIITLVKVADIDVNAPIIINGILEYKTYNVQPKGVSGVMNDLWPTVNIAFDYGVSCNFSQTQLATPVVSNIDVDGKIYFDPVDHVSSYKVYVYRDMSLLYEQEVEPGDKVDFVPLTTYNYTVKLKSLTNDIEYLDSEMSSGYSWYLVAGAVELDPSNYCNYRVGGSAKDYCYFTWETDASGNVVITISGYAGDTGTQFRGNGMGADLGGFKVNGANASNYFNRVYAGNGGSTFTLELKDGGDAIELGDLISYNGTLEWRTSQEGNAYLLGYSFPEYIYGSSCAGLPSVSVSPSSISFSPAVGGQTFSLSGSSLNGDISLNAPYGIKVTPSSISPDENGDISSTLVTVEWKGGTSNGSTIQISGGGLVSNVPVLINVSGFSDYCNKIIEATGGGYPVYLSINISEDSKEMYFDIAPVYGEEATWNGNSIPANNILVNGSAPSVTPIRSSVNGNTRIIISFDEELKNNDVVSFGGPIVWTTRGENLTLNTNCFIDPILTYTVGLSCDLDKGPSTLATYNPNNSKNIFYPNPAKDKINFSSTMSEASIYALNGQKIISINNVNSLDVANINRGLYILRTIDNNGVQTSSKIELK